MRLESPVYEQILEQGRELGRQQRRLLIVLEVRFGSVPSALVERVRQEIDLDRLQAWFRRAVVVESLGVFARELSEGSRSE